MLLPKKCKKDERIEQMKLKSLEKLVTVFGLVLNAVIIENTLKEE
jgi:hypothetical protein